MSSIGLSIKEYPEAVRVLLLCVSVTAVVTVICIGLISVEQRLRSSVAIEQLPERVANKHQCFWRVVSGGLFGFMTFGCLLLPYSYFNGIVSGSFLEHFEKLYECQISGLNFFCLTMLCVFSNLNYVMLAILSWLYLQNFHQKKVPSFGDKFSPTYQPAVHAVMICFGGAMIHVVVFDAFHPGPNVAPCTLLATMFCAWVGYKA